MSFTNSGTVQKRATVNQTCACTFRPFRIRMAYGRARVVSVPGRPARTCTSTLRIAWNPKNVSSRTCGSNGGDG